jgi:predicted transcriptional regulator
LQSKAVYSNPQAWIQYFRDMIDNGKFTNDKEAQYYKTKGLIAIEDDNIEELKRCASQLSLLLSEEDQKKINLSGITR